MCRTLSVLFAHGMESGPYGHKITALAKVAETAGFAVASPDYSASRDPDVRIAQLLALEPRADVLVLVGSSMGAYVSAIASRTLRPQGLFLMAPAVYMPGYAAEPEPVAGHTEIVHGWRDEVIPVAHAIRLAERCRARLHVLDSDHGLGDQLLCLEQLFAGFLDTTLALSR